MTLNEFLPVVGSVAAAIGVVASGLWFLIAKISAFSTRVELLEDRVDVIWGALMRRAEANAVINGMAVMNSPLVFNEAAFSWMAHLAAPLREAYDAKWKGLDDYELAFQIEKEFGEQIRTEVCIPHKIKDFECLLIACKMLRGNGPALVH